MLRFLPIFVLLAAAAIASKIPLDARQAHREADDVLWPNFVSVSNDWAIHHGVADPGHLDKIDAGDRKRVEATFTAFKAWQDAMKQAGY